MQVILAEHYGMCFGVRDALAQAERLAAAQPLTVLGELAHNPLVTERLSARGAHEGRLDDLSSAPTRQVLITAHGASHERRAAWKAAGYMVADASCPLVRRAHRQLAGLVANGYFPVVIGRRQHVEVRGLTGDFPGAAVLETEADLQLFPMAPRYGVIAQTTQPPDLVERLVSALRSARPDAEIRFCDTVCQPTKDRQTALRDLVANVDVVVVVGGRGSNNTGQLAHTAAAAGRRVHRVERADDLQTGWFRHGDRVGLTAGTSTLPETVEAVRARLEEIAREYILLKDNFQNDSI